MLPVKCYLKDKRKKNSETTKRKNEISADQKNSLDKIEDNRPKTITIIGDSMISYQDEKLHTNKKRVVKVRSYPGATIDDLIDYCRPIAHRQPDIIIVLTTFVARTRLKLLRISLELKTTLKKLVQIQKH